jgi:hypothetical protein
MTATLTDQQHILLVPAADEAARVAPALGYHVMLSTDGVITLRPKKQHKMSLVEHLRGFEGLELQRRDEHISKPIDL